MIDYRPESFQNALEHCMTLILSYHCSFTVPLACLVSISIFTWSKAVVQFDIVNKMTLIKSVFNRLNFHASYCNGLRICLLCPGFFLWFYLFICCHFCFCFLFFGLLRTLLSLLIFASIQNKCCNVKMFA